MNPPEKETKICKHCNPSQPHVIEENQSENRLAKQVSDLVEMVKAHQKLNGGHFNDDWLYPELQARLVEYSGFKFVVGIKTEECSLVGKEITSKTSASISGFFQIFEDAFALPADGSALIVEIDRVTGESKRWVEKRTDVILSINNIKYIVKAAVIISPEIDI